MLSKILAEGDKIELQTIDRKGQNKTVDGVRTYHSSIQNIMSEDTMEIEMPIEAGKLILLPVDAEYDMFVYTDQGVYQCIIKIIDRYKSNNVYLLAVELSSNLRKYQRREFFRFSCALEMCARTLEEEELQAFEKREGDLQPGLPLKRSVIVDISGGGLRFISNQKYEPESFLYCTYSLLKDQAWRKYEVVGKVLAVKPVDNRPGVYEHRVQYHNLDRLTREEIIKYIFEEERKSRQKGKNL